MLFSKILLLNLTYVFKHWIPFLPPAPPGRTVDLFASVIADAGIPFPDELAKLDVPPACPALDPATGEIDDCFVTVDGNCSSSEESPDSG